MVPSDTGKQNNGIPIVLLKFISCLGDPESIYIIAESIYLIAIIRNVQVYTKLQAILI